MKKPRFSVLIAAVTFLLNPTFVTGMTCDGGFAGTVIPSSIHNYLGASNTDAAEVCFFDQLGDVQLVVENIGGTNDLVGALAFEGDLSVTNIVSSFGHLVISNISGDPVFSPVENTAITSDIGLPAGGFYSAVISNVTVAELFSNDIALYFGTDDNAGGFSDISGGLLEIFKYENNPPTNVPIPGGLPLLAVGLVTLGLATRRKRS